MAEPAKKTILVVEDHADVGELMVMLVRLKGCQAAHVSSGQAALAYLKQHHVDLVVLDGHMPGLSGFEVLEALAIPPNDATPVPVVMYSADDRLREGALKRGAVAFVSKTSIDSLLAAVARYA